MKNVKGTTLEEIVAKLDSQQKRIADDLRSLTRRVLPEIAETIRWGNITFKLKGKDLSWIIFYKDHVDYGFFRGAELKSELLEGTGKGMRHVKMPNDGDIPSEEIAKLLVEASKLSG